MAATGLVATRLLVAFVASVARRPFRATRCPDTESRQCSRGISNSGGRAGYLRFTTLVFSLLHVLAAIDRDVGTGDKSSLLACQVGQQPGHLFWLNQGTQGDLGDYFRIED